MPSGDEAKALTSAGDGKAGWREKNELALNSIVSVEGRGTGDRSGPSMDDPSSSLSNEDEWTV